MPTLDWLNREAAFRTAAGVPTRVLRPHAAGHRFWLPTSSGRFYPDFVCELVDKRVFVAEYKGDHLRAVPKEIEKGQVGRVWAERSAGRAVFAMLYKSEQGRGLTAQIDAALARPAAADAPTRST